jgi:hypothetical protein
LYFVRQFRRSSATGDPILESHQMGLTVRELCPFPFTQPVPRSPRPMTKNALAQRRNRVVNFRVSEAEYDRLRVISKLEGDRGLSEYARQSTLRAAENLLTMDLSSRLLALESKVEILLGQPVSGARAPDANAEKSEIITNPKMAPGNDGSKNA